MRVFLLLCICLFVFPSAQASNSFKVCWSHYIGWEPWAYAQQSGVLEKWAKKYGIEIQLELVPDYLASIEAYTRGEYDACTMTQMDALTIPAAQGVDTSVVIIGDYSNGSDGLVVRGIDKVDQLRGRQVYLVQHSVSHYLLARALAESGLTLDDVPIVDAKDAELIDILKSKPAAAVVTWNPILHHARQLDDVTVLFDSSDLPGEILDIMAVRTSADERLKKALTGAWYEVMTGMRDGNPDMLEQMAASADVSIGEFTQQLASTKMLYSAGIASRTAKSKATINATRKLLAFCQAEGLLDGKQGGVGIAFGTRAMLGNRDNIKLRFVSDYMRMAAQGAL